MFIGHMHNASLMDHQFVNVYVDLSQNLYNNENGLYPSKQKQINENGVDTRMCTMEIRIGNKIHIWISRICWDEIIKYYKLGI